MKKIIVLGAVLAIALASLPLRAGPALEPAEAGRQARDGLDALMDKQRKDRRQRQDRKAAGAPSADKPKTTPKNTGSPAKAKGRAPGAVERRIPAICIGCGAKPRAGR